MSAADTQKDEIKLPNRPIKPPVRKLSEADFSLTESLQMFITVTPQVGTTREDMLKPIFWSHVARRLKPMAEIRALPKDGNWYGVYLVTYSDNIQAQLKELAYYPLENSVEPLADSDPFYVEWISPPVKYGIRRKADKAIVKDGFASKDQALAWKRENLPIQIKTAA